MTRPVPVLLLLLAITGCPAQTVVRFAPAVGYSEQNTPVAAGFAYAFRAPVGLRSAKSIHAFPVEPLVVSKSFETQIHDYESPRENSIVPVFHPKPPKHVLRKEPVYQEVIIPQVMKTQYHSQDELGQYAYGYVHNDASHHEERSLNGGVTGSYSYYDDLGRKQSTNYVADSNGFRVQATNLHPYIPEPVSQTPEVLAATKAHLLAVKKERSRKLLGKHIHVGIADTPEVAAAREAHLLAFDQIKRAHQKRWKRSPRGPYGGYAAVPVSVTPTPEVQAAAHAHLQAAKAAHTYGIHVGIPDTPAVAAAKKAHHYAYKKIQAQHAQRWKRSAYRSQGYEAQSQSYNAPGFQTQQYPSFSQQQYASNAQNIHLPVTPTPEVQAATYGHLQALNTAYKYGGNVHVGIPDTPAVAAAKKAHHYAYKKIQAQHAQRWKRSAYRSQGYQAQSQSYNAPGFQTQQYPSYSQQQYASNAQNIHLPVTPTPEVQAATYGHLQALNTAYKYGGNVHVGIPDTPEVAAAKDAHQYAYQKIQADHLKRWKRSARWPHYSGFQSRHHSYQGYQQPSFNYQQASSHNPFLPVTPTPAVQAATYDHLKAVHVAQKYGGNVHVGIPDTPEVAAAKNAHLQAYQYIAQDHAKRWRREAIH